MSALVDTPPLSFVDVIPETYIKATKQTDRIAATDLADSFRAKIVGVENAILDLNADGA